MARKPADNPARARFAALLAGHLARGTRPAKADGEPWTYEAFAAEVPSSRDEESFASPRSVSNWCKGASLPAEIEPILRALFGPGDRHAEARAALRAAFLTARAETIEQAERDPAGATWIVQGDQLAIDRTTRPTDLSAAADKVRQQLQAAIRDMAEELIAPAARLSNTRTWGSLSKTAAAFHAVVDGDPLLMPEHLGEAYARLLRLGRFLETDIRVQRDGAACDDPLDADIHGLLTDLVRTAAPWLRGFPTVAAWDDEAGNALVRAELFQPAREFIRIARTQQAIPEQDATEAEVLAEAADATDYQGQKAGNRAVGDARNLLLAAATLLSGSVAAGFSTRSMLLQRLGSTLAAAEPQVEDFAATVPSDLRHALRSAVKEGRRQGHAVIPACPPPPEPPVPAELDGIEAKARTMILEGHEPPIAWRLFITNLDLSNEKIRTVAPLSILSRLQCLSLTNTQVSDLGPLASLTNLEALWVRNTPVKDLGPLAGLAGLVILNLTDTEVSDLTPLASLTNLQSLHLSNTLVSDLAPLAGLADLQDLYLTNTRVSDLAPLTRLFCLEHLYLRNTRVIDTAPLDHLVRAGLQIHRE